MTEYFRITGLNLIPFDAQVTPATDVRYTLAGSPKGMDEPLSKEAVRAVVPRLPREVRGHALKRGLSRITFPFSIQGYGATAIIRDGDMEDARHDLTETLEDGQLYIATQGARGTRAVLRYQADGASQASYKTIFYGEAVEGAAREILGSKVKESYLQAMQMTLYCEPYWRPASAITLGPNEIYCPSFEEDGNADGLADDWDATLGGELLLNPGFEIAGGGGADIWANWTENAGDGALADVGAPVHGGAHACQSTAGPSANTYVVQTIGVTAGRLYYLSFWTRGDGTNDGRYRVRDATGAADIIPITNTGVTGAAYAEVTAYFLAPAGCANVELYLYCSSVNTAIVYFDDASIRAADADFAIETTIVLHGCDSQKVTTDAANEGIESTVMVAPAGTTKAVAYAWICRPAAGSDIRVIMRDTTAGVDKDTNLFSTPGLASAPAKDGANTFYRVWVYSNAIVAGNDHELWVESVDATATVFYVDKCFWKWDTTSIPDEWCDHWLIYNHYDTTEGAAHEGHINYVDVDDLKGDVEARLLMRTEFEQKADLDYAVDIIAGRRTRAYPCELLHWLEAEDAGTKTN